MADIEMQSTVLLKCVKERGKLRVKILTAGYLNEANCQFPRDIRKEGCFFKAKALNVRLISTRGKYYYSISRGHVEVLGDSPEAHDFEGVRVRDGAPPSAADLTANITVFEDDRTDECCICMSENKQIVFNCGHLYTCKLCSVSVHTCPICRQRITQRIPKEMFG
jgi:hypothetical protein